VFKICPSCQYIAMREHESACPICNGELAEKSLAVTSPLRSPLFAHTQFATRRRASNFVQAAEADPASEIMSLCQYHDNHGLEP
jgi:hypothetical protein